MPKARLPLLLTERTRHGQTVYYVRRGDGPRTRILGAYGSPDFMAAYRDALAGASAKTDSRRPHSGSLAWLIEKYRESNAWKDLSRATRRQRENIFRQIITASGSAPFMDVDRDAVEDGRDRRADTPFQARHYLDALRGLFRWALDKKHVTIDPTASVENLKRKGGPGFLAWTEDDVTAYHKRWPVGTKERVWLDVLLYTGLRRGDACTIGRQHVRDGIATIKTEKTGMEVSLPLLPDLQRTIAAGPTSDLAFICGERRQPLKKEAFGNMFREACRAAGVEKSAHGVRKIAATRLADSGASEAQLDAIFGWAGGDMAQLYTRTANRRRLAREAMEKLTAREQTADTETPHPSDGAPHPEKTEAQTTAYKGIK
jgi:integrase